MGGEQWFRVWVRFGVMVVYAIGSQLLVHKGWIPCKPHSRRRGSLKYWKGVMA